MGFDVSPAAYARFMGRYSEPLAVTFADFALRGDARSALDVGAGTGALTAVLAARLGTASVHAADPSIPFVAALRERLPGLDVREAPAERLPYADASVDLVAAQLVVPFLADPVAGLAEMARVARPGGTVAACVWDHEGGGSPTALFWRAAGDVDPAVPGERAAAGAREGQLAELFVAAGLPAVTAGSLSVSVPMSGFEEWWTPFTLGVGPAGDHLAALDEPARAAVRRRCAELLPAGPFVSTASCWAVRASR